MKKILSMLLVALMLTGMLSTFVVSADGVEEVNTKLSVKNGQGFASQAVTVAVTLENANKLSGASINVNYDTRLELLYVTNGDFFKNMTPSAIYKQNAGAVNGVYTYNGLSDGENINTLHGTLFYMTFVIPADAKAGDVYNINVGDSSKLVTGVDSETPYNIQNGKISVIDNQSNCQEHVFSEPTVVSESGYISDGYSYKICTQCNAAEIEHTEATEVNALEFAGMSMNYTANPSGIAPMYNIDAIKFTMTASTISAAGYSVELGIMATRNGEVVKEEILYKNGSWTAFPEKNVVFLKLENIYVYDKYSFKAYVKIYDPSTLQERVIYTDAILRGSTNISISDVVNCMDISKYQETTQKYLNNIKNGLIQK